jgi:hypothetical protein
MRRIGSGVGVGGIGGGGGVGGIGGGVGVTSVCRGVGKRGGVATVAAAVGGGGGRHRRGGGSGVWRQWAARARWEASSFSSNGGGGERIRESRVSIFTGQANILRAKQNLHWPTKI